MDNPPVLTAGTFFFTTTSTSGATNGGLGVGALDAFFAAGTGTLTIGGGGYASWAAANPGLTVIQGSPAGFDTVTLVLPRGLDAARFARLQVTVTP